MSGFKGDIYADRILHDTTEERPVESAGQDLPHDGRSSSSAALGGHRRGGGGGGKGESFLRKGGGAETFESAMLEVEDIEDVAAMQQTRREEKQVKQENEEVAMHLPEKRKTRRMLKGGESFLLSSEPVSLLLSECLAIFSFFPPFVFLFS